MTKLGQNVKNYNFHLKLRNQKHIYISTK